MGHPRECDRSVAAGTGGGAAGAFGLVKGVNRLARCTWGDLREDIYSYLRWLLDFVNTNQRTPPDILWCLS